MEMKNRLAKLTQAGATFNGIDFVEVLEAAPSDLRVHFVNGIAVKEPGVAATVDGGDAVPQVKIAAIGDADWSTDGDGRPRDAPRTSSPNSVG